MVLTTVKEGAAENGPQPFHPTIARWTVAGALEFELMFAFPRPINLEPLNSRLLVGESAFQVI
jgi:hypothetical protein